MDSVPTLGYLAIVGGTEESLDQDINTLSKYRSAETLKPSEIAHKKKLQHPKDASISKSNDPIDMTKALEAYSLINSAIGDTLSNDLMLLSNHRSAASVQTKVNDTIDMTKAVQAYSLIDAAMGDTLSNDLMLISNQKSIAVSGEGSVASIGSLASSKSHRSAAISKEGSLKSFQRNSSVQSDTVESSSIGTSKTPSGKKHYIIILLLVL